MTIIYLSYRLAPKHPFPVQFHECYAVVDTVLDNANLYGMRVIETVLLLPVTVQEVT